MIHSAKIITINTLISNWIKLLLKYYVAQKREIKIQFHSMAQFCQMKNNIKSFYRLTHLRISKKLKSIHFKIFLYLWSSSDFHHVIRKLLVGFVQTMILQTHHTHYSSSTSYKSVTIPRCYLLYIQILGQPHKTIIQVNLNVKYVQTSTTSHILAIFKQLWSFWTKFFFIYHVSITKTVN